MRKTRYQNARAQRAMRLEWNAERLAAKRRVDELIAAEVEARSLERLETRAEVDDLLGRVSDERRANHLAEKDRLFSDVSRIVTDVNKLMQKFQTQSDHRIASLRRGQNDVASMLAEFNVARVDLRGEQRKFGNRLRSRLVAEARRVCCEDFTQR
jgi:hypothetical protein